ncbi:DJ-1/PfpI family protein [Halopseudomonas sabulinigri]|uniref:DJ-1/PfpI family protein n=1 Tax=Halopseudomonas sabulinigri TaxID=472181 RepID=A0A1H1W4H4_9GAMM|nr:DJ-1/PfpI family protein [Halopseudomonas sabulinigri]SDS91406.1 DJ-1/PfpI family protein [Halopseudomonas sabulinigri]
MNIGIYLYEQAEVLDFAGPFEVFSTAARLSEPSGCFQVSLIAGVAAPVTARGGLRVIPDHDLRSHPPLQALIVPGGVHTAELQHTEMLQWLRDQAAQVQIMASVCTGAFLLAQAGLLDGEQVTTHWEDIADLRAAYPQLEVLERQRWVDRGKRVTSAGISAGIDMSLHLVERLHSRDLAERTARQMEFDWTGNAPA